MDVILIQRVSDYNGLSGNDIVGIEWVKYFKIRQSKTKRMYYVQLQKKSLK